MEGDRNMSSDITDEHALPPEITQLDEEESRAIAIALKEAHDKGLPLGWTMRFCGRQRRKRWISPEPNSRVYESLRTALPAAGFNPEEVDAALSTGGWKGNKRTIDSVSESPPSPIEDHSIVSTKAEGETECTRGPSLAAIVPKSSGVKRRKSLNARWSRNKKVNKVPEQTKSAGSIEKTNKNFRSSNSSHEEGKDHQEKEESDCSTNSNFILDNNVFSRELEENRSKADNELDPETSLDLTMSSSCDDWSTLSPNSYCPLPAKTIYWDPTSREGQILGSRLRLWDRSKKKWKSGRIIRFDPFSGKHKIDFYSASDLVPGVLSPWKGGDDDSSKFIGQEWLLLFDGDANVCQVGTRFVWALVRGFAWWPAQVMLTIGNNPPDDVASSREGCVYVEFFGSNQVSMLKDSADNLQPFNGGETNAIIRRLKKKLNKGAIGIARAEHNATVSARNYAIGLLATKAFHLANYSAGMMLGRRVQVFRSDLNYPYGEIIRCTVRQYSQIAKKWLLDGILSDNDEEFTGPSLSLRVLTGSSSSSGSSTKRYNPSWHNIFSKEFDLKVLPDDRALGKPIDGRTKRRKNIKGMRIESDIIPTCEDIAPFVFGCAPYEACFQLIFESKCVVCLQCVRTEKESNLPDDDGALLCAKCGRWYHKSCLDPLSTCRQTRSLLAEEKGDNDQITSTWMCDKCTHCQGCCRLDIVFGSKLYSKPITIVGYGSCGSSKNSRWTVNDGVHPRLCSMCTERFDNGQFCPNCGCTFDDDAYLKARQTSLSRSRVQSLPSTGISAALSLYRSRGRLNTASVKNACGTMLRKQLDCDFISVHPPKPSWLLPDSDVWGYNEGAMLICDLCHKWVHAGCAGINQDEYEAINRHSHEIYSREFLCGSCCWKRCTNLIEALKSEDRMELFAAPVTEEVAPNYRDVIKTPMDLATMRNMLLKGECSCSNYYWVKERFEQMVFNALVFNRPNSKYWNEARRFHQTCLDKVFTSSLTPAVASITTRFTSMVKECYRKATEELQNEQDRKRSDATATTKDLVAGAGVSTPQILCLGKPVDIPSCVPHALIRLNRIDAHYTCWMDACFTCGSSGAADTFLFCVDCGEAYHSFCVSAPVLSMDEVALTGWRCPNCKVCEISGEVPEDETKLLYCEMCDRAYCFDLLDPPLDSVPAGQWFCGQCVACDMCDGEATPSKRYWSRDAKLCYRCGGCEGLIEKTMKSMECLICAKLFRKLDSNILKCAGCKKHTHLSCDAGMRTEPSDTKALTDVGVNKARSNYKCPLCREATLKRKRESKLDKEAKKISRQILRQSSSQIVSSNEVFRKMEDEINWQTKELWRYEYKEIDAVALAFLQEAENDATRILTCANCPDGAKWMLSRAARWVRMSKNQAKMKRVREYSTLSTYIESENSDLSSTAFVKHHISTLVLRAKNAASFVVLACHFFARNFSDINCWRRAVSLLTPPDECGVVDLPNDVSKLNEGHILERIWGQNRLSASGFVRHAFHSNGSSGERKDEIVSNRKTPTNSDGDKAKGNVLFEIINSPGKFEDNQADEHEPIQRAALRCICEKTTGLDGMSNIEEKTSPIDRSKADETGGSKSDNDVDGDLCDFVSMPVELQSNPLEILRVKHSVHKGPSIALSHDETAKASATQRKREMHRLRRSSVPIALPLRGWSGCPGFDEAWSDPRTCCLCHTCGDDDGGLPASPWHKKTTFIEGEVGHAGRLLPMTSGSWAHASCARWSAEAWESADGALHEVNKARYRGSKMKCFGCGRPGPTLGCSKLNCPINYHFPCAVFCGSVFTETQHMFCRVHRDNASGVISVQDATFELMKTLRIDETEAPDVDDDVTAFRIGGLVVHALGKIEQSESGFHSKNYITPPGYIATRVFWSFSRPMTRTVYVMKIDSSTAGKPEFTLVAADDGHSPIKNVTVDGVYESLMEKVADVNRGVFSQGDLTSLLPMRRKRLVCHGLNGPQVGGLSSGLLAQVVRKMLFD